MKTKITYQKTESGYNRAVFETDTGRQDQLSPEGMEEIRLFHGKPERTFYTVKRPDSKTFLTVDDTWQFMPLDIKQAATFFYLKDAVAVLRGCGGAATVVRDYGYDSEGVRAIKTDAGGVAIYGRINE